MDENSKDITTQDLPVSNWRVFWVLAGLMVVVIITIATIMYFFNVFRVSDQGEKVLQSQLITSQVYVDLTAVTMLKPCQKTLPLAISFGPSYDLVVGMALMIEPSKNPTPTICGVVAARGLYNIDIVAGSDNLKGLIVIYDLESDADWVIEYKLSNTGYILNSRSDDLFIDHGSVVLDAA